jgi:integrase
MKVKSERYIYGEKALTRSEYEKLISVITDPQDELLIKMAVATGLRREDLCDIETNNINLKDKTLMFYEAKKKKWRSIDLPDSVITIIEKFYNTLDIKEQEQDKTKKLFDFCGRTAYRHLNHWCSVASIPERPFHSLRATCIKFAHNAGWTDEQISRLTGDKIATIQEQYKMPGVDEMREVVRLKPIV